MLRSLGFLLPILACLAACTRVDKQMAAIRGAERSGNERSADELLGSLHDTRTAVRQSAACAGRPRARWASLATRMQWGHS
jgi:hypothetical protein